MTDGINRDAGFSLGEKIAEARMHNGISQKELAQKSGLTQGNVSLIERGKANPSLKTIARIADALNQKVVFTLTQVEEEDDAYDR